MARPTTLNHVNFSDDAAKDADSIPMSFAPLTDAPPQKPVKYFVYRLANSKRRGKVHIDGIDDAIHPVRKVMERMRLLRGVPTVWMSEQKDLDKNFVERNRMSLVFEGDQRRKILRVPEWDVATLEFIKNCKHLIDNPNRRSGSKHEFYEWNPQKQQEAAMKMRLRKVDAMKRALQEPEAQMRKHALYLGINFSDEVGEPKTEEGIRNDYVLKAEENPERFFDSLASPIVHVSYVVKKCISDSKIDLGREVNKAYWAAGGGFIAQIPQNRKAAEYLIELAMTNSEAGKNFLEQLEAVSK